jgi:hypothetical protein
LKNSVLLLVDHLDTAAERVMRRLLEESTDPAQFDPMLHVRSAMRKG